VVGSALQELLPKLYVMQANLTVSRAARALQTASCAGPATTATASRSWSLVLPENSVQLAPVTPYLLAMPTRLLLVLMRPQGLLPPFCAPEVLIRLRLANHLVLLARLENIARTWG
jgi:hypothetical protein